MQVSMENSTILNARVGPSVNGSKLASNGINESDDLDKDSNSYEKFIREMDSYWDDLESLLIVSRMVNDSVTKGIVNAVGEEAAGKIAEKEVEIANLNEKLRHFEFNSSQYNISETSAVMLQAPFANIKSQGTKQKFYQCSLDAGANLNPAEHLGGLKVAAEEHLQKLKEEIRDIESMASFNKIDPCLTDMALCNVFAQGKTMEKLRVIDGCVGAFEVILAAVFEQSDEMCSSLKALASEQQLEYNFQRELTTILVQSFVSELQDEFETKLCEQRYLVKSLQKNNQKMVDDLTTLRHQLDAISKSLVNFEISHSSFENLEDSGNHKRKDHSPWKVVGNHHLTHASNAEEEDSILMEKSSESIEPRLIDSPHMKCMTREELISYFKTELTNMKRQYDKAVQEKTEQLFSLKREFLKLSNPSHLRKEKDSELLRKKISEFISKLDDILLYNKISPTIDDNQDALHNLQEMIDALVLENKRLQGLLMDKREAVECVPSQVLDAADHSSSVEVNFLKQIEKLRSDNEDLQMEAITKDEIQKTILRELVSELETGIGSLEMEFNIVQDIYSIIYRETLGYIISGIKPILVDNYEERDSFAALLLEKENSILLRNDENSKLKQAVDSLTVLINEKENFASQIESRAMEQKVQFDLACHELCVLKDQVIKQDLYISDGKREFDLMKGRLDESLHQIKQYEEKLSDLNMKLKAVSDSLEETEKQNKILNGIIEEKQKTLSSTMVEEEQHKRWMESINISMMELSKAIMDCENKLTNHIELNESRLKALNQQCSQLLQQADFLKRKTAWYKQRFEIRCSDLQKAETEVDLLGDEVDTLLRLLEKIYIALEHYSPVLQHYTGVVEILNMIKREMRGETTKPR